MIDLPERKSVYWSSTFDVCDINFNLVDFIWKQQFAIVLDKLGLG